MDPKQLAQFSRKVKAKRPKLHEKVVLGHKEATKARKQGFVLEVLEKKPALERIRANKTKEFEAELLGRHKRLSLSRVLGK